MGIEIEAKYCVWIEQRLAMAECNKEIQGYINGVFWDRNSLSERKSEVCKTSIVRDKPGGKSIQETGSLELTENGQRELFDYEEDSNNI